jgi:hypothetical protein
MITVQPTGVFGQGKTRYYPDPTQRELENNAWWYATRLSNLINPDTGDFYVPRGALGTFMYARAMGNYAETVDAWLYPEEYWDEEEARRQGRMVEQDNRPVAPGAGPYRFSLLNMVDAQYLNWLVTSDPAVFRDAWLRCIDGEWLDICRLSNAAIYGGEFDVSGYTGPVRAVAKEIYGRDQ